MDYSFKHFWQTVVLTLISGLISVTFLVLKNGDPIIHGNIEGNTINIFSFWFSSPAEETKVGVASSSETSNDIFTLQPQDCQVHAGDSLYFYAVIEDEDNYTLQWEYSPGGVWILSEAQSATTPRLVYRSKVEYNNRKYRLKATNNQTGEIYYSKSACLVVIE